MMARGRLQSSRFGCLSVSYYLRRPRRLAILCSVFAVVTFLFWDRHSLLLQHEVDISKLGEEKSRLVQEVDELKIMLRKREDLSLDLDNEEFHDFDHEGKAEDGDDDLDSEDYRRAPILDKRGTVDGMREPPADPDPVARERRDKIREAMVHAWGSYEKYAWGWDELRPMSRSGKNDFGGLGATIVDSLDTLFIMGLHEQFQKATEWVSTSLNFNKPYSASVFETTIRVLGGLLSAYDLSGDPLFIGKAQELADRLLPAWETSTGIPLSTIELSSGNALNPYWTGGSSVLADLGTEQVELIGLSQRTGIPKYREKAERVIRKLKEIYPADGLLPMYISPHTGQPTTQRITFGAMGDSFYEYLLKTWILGNKTDVVQHYRTMWEQSMEGMMSLVRKSNPSSYVYIAERNGDSLINKMDELACFAAGMLTLGSDGASPEKAAQYLEIADGLAWTCYNFYQSTRTHLAGENYHFADGQDMNVGVPYNILRPETIESLFYLWRKTGNTKYREWGWKIFEAFETHSRVESGYVGLQDVNSGVKDDNMQSFFLAETLKYLYLLYSPSDVISLDEWVFNTEAHPIRIITRLEETEDQQPRDRSGLVRKERGAAQARTGDDLTKKYIRKGSRGAVDPFDYR